MRRSDLLADELDARLRAVSPGAGVTVGVSVFDSLTGTAFGVNADRWFHAASIIKLPILLALFDAVDRGRFSLNARLLVRNRFLSAVDGTPFRVDPARDGDSDVHAARGRTMKLGELANRMIVRSSNLATNLLVDLLGVAAITSSVRRFGIGGIDLSRGVEDHRAFEYGMSNRMTPDGAVDTLCCILGSPALTLQASARMIEILLAQQLPGTIVPGLPERERARAHIANKTGDISTVTHDAGIVFLPDRPPYIVAIFSENDGDARTRTDASIAASAAVYDCLAADAERG